MAPTTLTNFAAQDPRWRARIDKAWATPAQRQAFEAAEDMKPLADDTPTRRQQAIAGYERVYRDAFSVWVTETHGIQDIAPADVLAAIANKKKTDPPPG